MIEWEVQGASWGSHQLCTSCTEGVPSTRSGSRLISFMMLARRTGNSCLRNVKEVFSQALLEPEGRDSSKPPKLETIVARHGLGSQANPSLTDWHTAKPAGLAPYTTKLQPL